MREVGGARPSDGLSRVVGFSAAFLAVGMLSRLVVLPGQGFSLIWPAAGVAVLWFLVRRATLRSVDTPALAVTSFATNYLTGAALDVALLLALTNLVQTIAAVALLRRWCPDLWGCGGTRGFDSSRLLGRAAAALALGMALGAILGAVGLGMLARPGAPVEVILWFARNLAGALVITPLGLLVGHHLATSPPRRPLIGGTAARAELTAATLFTVGLYAVGMGLEWLPLTFVLPAATVWVGARFCPLVTAAHSSLAGIATVVLTLSGVGPFAEVADSHVAAALAQGYVGTVLLMGLALSTRREENRLLEAELRAAERSARYQASLLDTVITSMSEGVAVVDEAGKVLVQNPAADRLGYLAQVPTSGPQAGFEVYHPDGTPYRPEDRPSRRALRGEVVANEEVTLSPDGAGPVLSVSASPLAVPESGHPRVLLMFRDYTEAYVQRAELATFAGTVAHDLRNPLSAIEGWAEVLEDDILHGTLDPRLLADFLTQVRNSTRRMDSLIGDLLDHATSSNRRLTLEKVSLDAVVERIADSRDVRDRVTCGPLPWVRADQVLVTQAFDNLIGNALKYVAPGTDPEITVSGVITDSGWARITVADNGIGLPPDQHERIFQEFHRAHVDGYYEGTGLGLAIVRRIVMRHGGTVAARNRPGGGGAVFELTLPAYE